MGSREREREGWGVLDVADTVPGGLGERVAERRERLARAPGDAVPAEKGRPGQALVDAVPGEGGPAPAPGARPMPGVARRVVARRQRRRPAPGPARERRCDQTLRPVVGRPEAPEPDTVPVPEAPVAPVRRENAPPPALPRRRRPTSDVTGGRADDAAGQPDPAGVRGRHDAVVQPEPRRDDRVVAAPAARVPAAVRDGPAPPAPGPAARERRRRAAAAPAVRVPGQAKVDLALREELVQVAEVAEPLNARPVRLRLERPAVRAQALKQGRVLAPRPGRPDALLDAVPVIADDTEDERVDPAGTGGPGRRRAWGSVGECREGVEAEGCEEERVGE